MSEQLIAWVKDKMSANLADLNAPMADYDRLTAIAALLEADGQLREVIQQELDNDNEPQHSLQIVALEAGLWPKGEQAP